MGCGTSSKKGNKSKKENTDIIMSSINLVTSASFITEHSRDLMIKAALVIQNWYRRYRARLRVRQHYALAIFQSIEYSDEQGQMQLSSFFSFMLENYTKTNNEDSALVTRIFDNTRRESQIKDRDDFLGLIEVPDSYDGPRLQFPLTFTDIHILLQAFKQQQVTSSRSCSHSRS